MKDPPVMFDSDTDPSELVRTLVSAGRSDLPDPARMQAVWARLGGPAAAGANGQTGADGGGASGATANGAAGTAALKMTAGLLLGMVVAGGAFVGVHRASAPATQHPALAAPSPRASAPVPAIETAPSVATPDFAVPVTSLPMAAPTRVRPGPAPAPSSAADPPDESEIALLQAAQVALRDDPAAALAAADRHARRFSAGALAQEREVIAIEALLALGRGDDARDRGARFVRDFPSSAHRLRVESLLRGTDHNP